MQRRYPGRKKTRTWRAFLTPGWIIGTILIVTFSYFAFTFLAPWQLGKDHAITQRNERIQEAFSTDPVPYQDALDESGAIVGDGEWQRVILTGHYLAEDEVLLRMRPADGSPAYQSLTPFLTDSGLTILINRGSVGIPDGSTPEVPAPPTESITLVAVLRADETTPQQNPMTADGYQQVYGINTEQVGEITGLTLAHDYAQLSDSSQPGVLTPIEIPQLDRGSHLSYGLQWIAFGIMAPLGLGYFVWAELRERRRYGDEEEELAATTESTASPADAGGAASHRQRREAFHTMLWDDDEDLSEPPRSPFQPKAHEHGRSLVDRYGAHAGERERFLRKDEEQRF